MNKKYELTNEKIEHFWRILYRIKALKDFGNVKKGDLGGFVESEGNLSHCGDCWVYDNAKVFDNARVSGNAKIFDNAEVYGNAMVFSNAKIFGNAKVSGNVEVYHDARVYGDATVFDNAKIFDNAEVYGNAEVYDNAEVYGDARVFDNAKIFGNAIVYESATVFGNAKIFGNAKVSGYAFVRGHALLKGNVELTKRCLNITEPELYHYPITFTDRHITIGCKTMFFPEWLEVSKEDAIKMGLKEEYYDNVKNLLKLLIPQYYNVTINKFVKMKKKIITFIKKLWKKS